MKSLEKVRAMHILDIRALQEVFDDMHKDVATRVNEKSSEEH